MGTSELNYEQYREFLRTGEIDEETEIISSSDNNINLNGINSICATGNSGPSYTEEELIIRDQKRKIEKLEKQIESLFKVIEILNDKMENYYD